MRKRTEISGQRWVLGQARPAFLQRTRAAVGMTARDVIAHVMLSHDLHHVPVMQPPHKGLYFTMYSHDITFLHRKI